MEPNKYGQGRRAGFVEMSHPEHEERNPDYRPEMYPHKIKNIQLGLEKQAEKEKVFKTRGKFGKLKENLEHQ